MAMYSLQGASCMISLYSVRFWIKYQALTGLPISQKLPQNTAKLPDEPYSTGEGPSPTPMKRYKIYILPSKVQICLYFAILFEEPTNDPLLPHPISSLEIIYFGVGLIQQIDNIISFENINRSPMQDSSHSAAVDFSHPLDEGEMQGLVVEGEVSSRGESKNRRWGDEQHMLFIMFLEENREKIKSKLIRRSNSFFREMATFISTKNATQCRSYHQKYENKYKYPHRIIRQEKEKLDMALYEQLMIKKRTVLLAAEEKKEGKAEGEPQGVLRKRERTAMATSECQTDIQGVSTMLIQPEVGASQQQIKMVPAQPYMNFFPFLPPYHPPYYQW